MTVTNTGTTPSPVPAADTKFQAGTGAAGRARIGERTLRTDRWWQAPLVTFVLLSGWVLYATVRVLWQAAYFAPKEHYLTPFYSPCVTESCVPESRDFGTWLPKVPPLIPVLLGELQGVLRGAAGAPLQPVVRRLVEPVQEPGAAHLQAPLRVLDHLTRHYVLLSLDAGPAWASAVSISF